MQLGKKMQGLCCLMNGVRGACQFVLRLALKVQGAVTKNLSPCPKIGAGREYSERLKLQHAKLNPRTSWATLSKAKKKRQLANDDSDG